MKWRFAVKFLVTFALLVVFWFVTGFGEHYSKLVLPVAAIFSPLINGWLLDIGARGVFFRRGHDEIEFFIQLPALSMGLMPL